MTRYTRRRGNQAHQSALGTRTLAFSVHLGSRSSAERLRWEGIHARAVELAEEIERALLDFPDDFTTPSQEPTP